MVRPSRREALEVLYERHYAERVRLAFALTDDWGLAEELAQETFVRAWRSWANIRDPHAAPAYLRTIVVNLARSSLRRRLREYGAWRDTGESRSADPGVVLRFYLDLSEADTAAALGVSVGTVKSQTAKALQRLEQLLTEPVPAPVPRSPGHDHGGTG